MQQKRKINWWVIAAVVIIGVPLGFVATGLINKSKFDSGDSVITTSNDVFPTVSDDDSSTDSVDIASTVSGDDSPTNTVEITPTKPIDIVPTISGDDSKSALSVSTNRINFSSKGNDQKFTIRGNTEWRVDNSDASWVTIDPISGSNGGTITVSTDENATDAVRRGTIKVIWNGGSKIITITQEKLKTDVSVSTNTLHFNSKVNTQKFTINGNTSWSVDNSGTSWVTIDPVSGSNNGTITVTASENITDASRKGTIKISWNGGSKAITVTQEKLKTDVSVSTNTLHFNSKGNTQKFTISSNTNWSVNSSATSWVTIDPVSGSNNGTITVTASENVTDASRKGTIKVSWNGGSKVITVTQEKAGTELSVSTNSINFNSNGNAQKFNIQCNKNWNVEKNGVTWLTITPSSGKNDGNITVTATENVSSAERKGKIKVVSGGKTEFITVTQSKAEPKPLPVSEVQSVVVSGNVSSKVPDGCTIVMNGKSTTNYQNFRNGVKLGAYSNISVTKVEGNATAATKVYVNVKEKVGDD